MDIFCIHTLQLVSKSVLGHKLDRGSYNISNIILIIYLIYISETSLLLKLMFEIANVPAETRPTDY